MQYICNCASAPIRKLPTHTSEMVNQLLFGEVVQLIEADKQFSKVKCVYDNYIGWCANNQLTVVKDANFNTTNTTYTYTLINAIKFNNNNSFVLFATPIYNGLQCVNEYLFKNFSIEKFEPFSLKNYASFNEAFLFICNNYMGTPYLWGGKSIAGIDCSALVQQVFKFFEIVLPRDAHEQAETGDNIGFLQETKLGDLAFFDDEFGNIIHVGILLTPNTILHASGRVRIDAIDVAGIVNNETNQRTHQLRTIKRVLIQS